MGELRDEKIKDSLRRLEKMDEEDILSMSRPAQWRLALGFTHEELVRRIVAKGTDRYWKLRILEELGKAYRVGYMSLSNNDRYKYAQNGFTEAWPPYFEDIDFDIATNTPLLPDEESPLPNSNSSPSGEAGRGLLEARIAELEEENEALKEQVEHFRNMEKGTALGLNQAQAALFGLSLANTFEFQYTNKKKQLAPLLHKLFGWGQTKLKTCLSTPCEKEERDELANLFKELCPPLYDTIMKWGELPQ